MPLEGTTRSRRQAAGLTEGWARIPGSPSSLGVPTHADDGARRSAFDPASGATRSLRSHRVFWDAVQVAVAKRVTPNMHGSEGARERSAGAARPRSLRMRGARDGRGAGGRQFIGGPARVYWRSPPAVIGASICSSVAWSGPRKGCAAGAASREPSSRSIILPGAAGRWLLRIIVGSISRMRFSSLASSALMTRSCALSARSARRCPARLCRW